MRILGFDITRHHNSVGNQAVAQPQYNATGAMLYNTQMRTIRSDYANMFAPVNKLVQECVNREIYPLDQYGQKITYDYPIMWQVLQHPNVNMDMRSFLQTALIGYVSNPEVNILLWHGNTPGYTTLSQVSAMTFLPKGARYNLIDEQQYRVRGNDGQTYVVTTDDVATLRYSIDPDTLVAVSPGSASHQAAAIMDDMNMQLRSYFHNGAVPKVVVTIHAKTDQEFQAIKRNFERSYRGPANAGGTLYQQVIDNGIAGDGNPRIEITTVGAQADQMDVQKITDYASQQINNNLSVSSLIFGDTDANSYQNQEVVNDKFNTTVKNTLSQFLEDFQFELNRITGGIGFTFGFDFADTEFVEKELTQAQTKQAMAAAFAQLVNIGVPSDKAAEAVGAPNCWLGLGAEKATMATPVPVAQSVGADSFFNRTGKLTTVRKRQPDAHQRIKDILTQMAKSHIKRHMTNGIEDEDTKYINQIVAELQQIADNGGQTAARQLAQQIKGQTVDTGYEINGTPLQALIDRATKVIDNFSGFIDDEIASASVGTADIATGEVASVPQSQVLASLADSLASGDISDRIDAITLNEGKYAFQSGQQDSAEQIQDGYNVRVVKVWRAAGPNPCQFCAAMDGTEAGISDSFVPDGQIVGTDGGVMPLDTDYDTGEQPDAHVNCECVYEWHVESDDDKVPSLEDVL